MLEFSEVLVPNTSIPSSSFPVTPKSMKIIDFSEINIDQLTYGEGENTNSVDALANGYITMGNGQRDTQKAKKSYSRTS